MNQGKAVSILTKMSMEHGVEKLIAFRKSFEEFKAELELMGYTGEQIAAGHANEMHTHLKSLNVEKSSPATTTDVAAEIPVY
jgi:hypothetical protein